MKTKQHYLIALIALLIIPISGVSTDIYVPSLPMVAHFFHADKALVQLTITAYMIGFGVMQLFSGSLSDSIGRKKPFIISMAIYIAATFLATLSTTIYELLILRFIQGLMVGCFNVPMRALIADLFEGKTFYKMMGYMTMAWSIGPIIAPAIGGYLQHYFNWHAPFYFLMLYGLIFLVLNVLFVPETLKQTKSFEIKKVFESYDEILLHKEYIACLLCSGALLSLLILFSTVNSFFIQSVLHYSVITFGHIALLMGFAWFCGNTTHRLTIHYSMQNKVKLCFWLILLDVLVMLAIACIWPKSIYNLVITTFVLLYLGGIVFPSYFAKTVALFPHMAGKASALSGAFSVLIASIISALATLLRSNTQIPLALTYVGISIVCLLIFYWEQAGKTGSCKK